MSIRFRIRDAVPLAAWALAGWVGTVATQAQAPPQTGARPVAAATGPETPGADEKAIREADGAFVRGYNQGDAKALAAMFTEDAEVVEADGARYRGRDLIERSFAETFASNK